MNNKVLGTTFENEVCDILAKHGCWVHFITPDARGAQPFDIIAVKNDIAYAIECKTLALTKASFSISRLEDNQKLAFQRWNRCGNHNTLIFVKQGDNIFIVPYSQLSANGRVKLKDYMNTEAYKYEDFYIYGYGGFLIK